MVRSDVVVAALCASIMLSGVYSDANVAAEAGHGDAEAPVRLSHSPARAPACGAPTRPVPGKTDKLHEYQVPRLITLSLLLRTWCLPSTRALRSHSRRAITGLWYQQVAAPRRLGPTASESRACCRDNAGARSFPGCCRC